MKTTIRTILFYDRFSCLGKKCPLNCCHGWRIPLDDDCVRRYRREKSLIGLRARIALIGARPEAFGRWHLNCPMLDPDGYCSLQKARGEKFLPDTCRIYPRDWANLGLFVERTLDLSCIHAATLYLEAVDGPEGGLAFREETGLWELPRAGDNDDPGFLQKLIERRRDILAQLSPERITDAAALDDVIFALAEDARREQDLYLKIPTTGMRRIRLFPFSIMLLNEMMSTFFYEDGLKWTEPRLYRMCREYFRTFDPLTEIEGQKKLDEMSERYYREEKGPGIRDLLRYFTYSLIRRYYETYEDYSFLRRIEEAAVHLNMVFLFELLARNAGRELSIEERAGIIACYEKRTWHNEDVMGVLIKQLNGRFV
ncbi:MAG: flagellin lysine-N-methylase [Lachnospiraceae bacterium]|nr:flagellin lysine-N-methylase [Lachnospiraceae bacterium]